MKNGLQIQLIADEPSSRGMAPHFNPNMSILRNRACRAVSETGCKSDGLRYLARSFMAKTSWINRNARKRATVKKYATVRAELKAKKDYAGLAQLPRDASPTRVVNRCEVTGRRRAFIRRFKVSRLTFRELASQGLIPGVTKSSW
jgi:small subunit ribosomal protein S14